MSESPLQIIRMNFPAIARCACCGETKFCQHVDYDLNQMSDTKAGFVCGDCKNHVIAAELQLLAWLESGYAAHLELDRVNREFYQKFGCHWNSLKKAK